MEMEGEHVEYFRKYRDKNLDRLSFHAACEHVKASKLIMMLTYKIIYISETIELLTYVY